MCLIRLFPGSNKVSETICSRMLPLERCLIILTAGYFKSEAKIDCLNFIFHCYIDVEKSAKHSAEFTHNTEVWKLLEYFTESINALSDPYSEFSFCKPRESESVSRQLVVAFMPIVKSFFTLYFRRNRASDCEIGQANKLCDALVRYFGDAKDSAERIALSDALEIMEKRSLKGTESSTYRKLRSLLQGSKMHLAAKVYDQKSNLDFEEKILSLFSAFQASFRSRINIEKELAELVEVCRNYPRTITVIISQLTSQDVESDLKSVYVRTVKILWTTISASFDLSQCISFIQLDALIPSIFSLVAQGKGAIVKHGLQLANHLLENGSAQVQDHFRTALKHHTSQTFLRQLRLRLDIACDEIREQDTIVQQVVANAQLEVNGKPTLKALLTKANMFEDMPTSERGDFLQDSSCVQHVLLFLQALCVGHNLPMQNLLRSQGRGEGNIDLVSAVAEFIVELEAYCSPLNISIAIQAFETLTELLQGPCKQNILSVLKTQNFLEAINHLIRNDHTSLDGVSYTNDYFLSLQELRARMADTILAMLEGASYENMNIPQTLIRSLDLSEIVEYTKKMYFKWDNERNKQTLAGLNFEDNHITRLNHEVLNSGHAYYIVLRSLKNFASFLSVDENSRIAFSFVNESSPAMDYYRNSTGCIEISREISLSKASKSELIRVFFPIPKISNRVNHDMKTNIVFSVDRSNDAVRLRDFVSSVDDLYFDMKYAEWLHKHAFTRLIMNLGFWINRGYFVSIFVLNITLMIVLNWKAPNQSDPDAAWNERQHLDLQGSAKVVLQMALPSIQLIFEGAMLIYYIIAKVPAVIRRGFKNQFRVENMEDDEKEEFHQFDLSLYPRDIYFYCNFIRHLFADCNITSGQCFVWRLFTFVLALSININVNDVNQLPLIFYSILLWEVFPRSKQIGFVLKAIGQGGTQLLALAGMILITSYWFAVIGFLIFPEKFQFRKAEVIDGTTAQNGVNGFGNTRAVPLQYIFQGIVMVIDQGVRKEDVGDALDKFQWPNPCPDPVLFGCPPCPKPISYQCVEHNPCQNPLWLDKLQAYDRLDLCGDVFSWPYSEVFVRMVGFISFHSKYPADVVIFCVMCCRLTLFYFGSGSLQCALNLSLESLLTPLSS